MKGHDTESSLYRTSDLVIAAVLKYNGFPLKDVEGTESRAWFIFEGRDRIIDIINEYYNRSLKLEPRKFLDEIKALKGCIAIRLQVR